MLNRFLATDRSWSLLVQRIALGLVILPHGLQKVFGMWDGFGFTGTMSFFTDTLGVPAPIGFLVIVERHARGARADRRSRHAARCRPGPLDDDRRTLLWHWPNGFFMNWNGLPRGEGFEFHLLAIALALPLVLRGGGRLSLDRALNRLIAPALDPSSPSSTHAI